MTKVKRAKSKRQFVLYKTLIFRYSYNLIVQSPGVVNS